MVLVIDMMMLSNKSSCAGIKLTVVLLQSETDHKWGKQFIHRGRLKIHYGNVGYHKGRDDR